MRDLADLLAQVHFHGAVNHRDQEHHPRASRPGAYASQAEDYQSLVFRDDANGAGHEEKSACQHDTHDTQNSQL